MSEAPRGKSKRAGSGGVSLTGPWPFPWPNLMRCGLCGHPAARVYPFPLFEDADLLIPDEDLSAGGLFDMFGEERADWDSCVATMGGTIWCPNPMCSPPWGEALLRQMVFTSGALRGEEIKPPAVPLLGGYPAEAVGFLESELADFFDGPGPLSPMRQHWSGEGPVAPRGAEFLLACGQLVTWMREAHHSGLLTAADLGIPERTHDAGVDLPVVPDGRDMGAGHATPASLGAPA